MLRERNTPQAARHASKSKRRQGPLLVPHRGLSDHRPKDEKEEEKEEEEVEEKEEKEEVKRKDGTSK